MDIKRSQLPSWASSLGIILLKGFGWIAIAILVVYLASYFVKLPPNRADIFSLIEVLFGIVITALAIVASFAVSFQWNVLEGHIRDFQKEAEETAKEFNANTEMQAERLEEIKNIFNIIKEEINNKLNEQRDMFETQSRRIRALDTELTGLQALADTIIDLIFSVADINPPWLLEEWAREVADKYKTAEVPKNMTLSYLRIVNDFLTQPANNMVFFLQSLQERRAPSVQLSYYWEKVLEWKQATQKHYERVIGEVEIDKNENVSITNEPESLRIVKEKVNECRPKVEAWRVTYPDLWAGDSTS